MPTPEEVKRLFEEAFDDQHNPPLDSVFKPTAGYYFDSDLAEKDFVGRTWREISTEVIVRNRDRLSLMTPEAFHHYFPRFILVAIDEPERADVLVTNLLYWLIPPEEESYYPLFIERVALFSRKQAQAVLAYLTSWLEIYPPQRWSFTPEDAIELDKAVKYWRMKLDEMDPSP